MAGSSVRDDDTERVTGVYAEPDAGSARRKEDGTETAALKRCSTQDLDEVVIRVDVRQTCTVLQPKSTAAGGGARATRGSG